MTAVDDLENTCGSVRMIGLVRTWGSRKSLVSPNSMASSWPPRDETRTTPLPIARGKFDSIHIHFQESNP